MSQQPTKTPRYVPSATPVFDALLEEAQRTRPEDLLSVEEVAQRLGITEEELATARARIEQRAREEEAEDHASIAAPARNGAPATAAEASE